MEGFEVPWLWGTVCFGCAVFTWELCLDVWQIGALQRPVPPLIKPAINTDHFQQISQWSIQRLRFGILENSVGFMLELLVLCSGCLVWLADITAVSQQESGSFRQIAYGVFFIFMVSILSTVVKLPFELWRMLAIDAKVATTHASTKDILISWTLEQMRAFVASLVFGIPILGSTLALLCMDFPLQWLATAIFVSVVALFFSDLYADVLAPLYDSIVPLNEDDSREKELKSQIKRLAERLQVPLSEIYKITSLNHSTVHSNAFIMGFGWAKKRIVIYDNLICCLTTDEILAIVGHEIGHYKFHHLWKKLVIQLTFVGNFIFLFSALVSHTQFYNSFGFEQPNAGVGLVLFSYMYSFFASCMRALTNFISRRFEYTADEYAIQDVDLRNSMPSALAKLYALHNMTNVMPDWWYSVYHYSHPSLVERLHHIDRYNKQKSQ